MFPFLEWWFFSNEDFACLKNIALTIISNMVTVPWGKMTMMNDNDVKIQKTAPATISEMLMYNEEKYHFHLLVVYVYTSALFPAG